MKIKRSEAEVQRAVCKYLAVYYGHSFGRVNNTGSYRHDLKQYIPVPYSLKGFADLIVFTAGRTVFLELKSTIGKQTPEQKLFQKMCESKLAKREYYVIRSVAELAEKANL